jgi:hypothetical protein
VSQFDCAVWRPIGANTGGALGPIGVLMHQQVGYGSLYGFFGNPANEVSAHFWIARSGLIEQYVDSNVIAWHAMHLNGAYCGIEFEGMPEDPITDAQVASGGEVLAEGYRRHGWPLVLVDAAYGAGFGYHRMEGGVNTACPSDLRLSARSAMLAEAGAPSSAPTPQLEGHNMIASTSTGEGYWTVTRDGAVGAHGDAVYAGGGFDPDLVTGEIVGIAGKGNDGYWLYASDGGVMAFGSAEYLGRSDRF